MSTLQAAHLGKRTFVLLLLIASCYLLWLVADRWVAAIKYRIHFGADSESWVSLGFDTVLTGFASLVMVGSLSLWMHRKARDSGDLISQRITIASLSLSLVAFSALLVLAILPTTMFR